MTWEAFRTTFNGITAAINGVLWHPAILYVLLGCGLYLTLRGRLIQFQALRQGIPLVFGRGPKEEGPGAISHFQALSAALSATVGLGNIGGVALAIGIGGPGSVFWMWVVGFLGMALKSTEVTLSMMHRDTSDPDNPHGGPMYVMERGFKQKYPALAGLGRFFAFSFVVALLVAAFTGGNAFQAWNTAVVTEQYLGLPGPLVGGLLGALVAVVILGGVSRIGKVAGKIVPFMCGCYLLAALYVVAVSFDQLPDVLSLIFSSAFAPLSAQGAFIGGTAGWAFSTGMQRAFFSNEAGQGSSAMAHAAVKTNHPAHEGIVAGLEPFIDTLVVCTLTAFVILLSGSWNRSPDLNIPEPIALQASADGSWTLNDTLVEPSLDETLEPGRAVFLPLRFADDSQTGLLMNGVVAAPAADGQPRISWQPVQADSQPIAATSGCFLRFDGASLTAFSFDRVQPGLGRWLVTLATWFFALSTMISWSYYGEQGVVFSFGEKWVLPYRLVYCGVTVISASGLLQTAQEINQLTMLGTGAMLWVNIPIIILFSGDALRCLRQGAKEMAKETARQNAAPQPVRET
ncbi:alanine/glycine:cation symporter family protein [Acanthopleuribacter pedis]|uniref:Sodium:alanine symporter family protein n=1 Tax=Acanthopleuribacter pedis TaxID=442870 RepID=A0A8J7U5I2_9BACT|nr:amino acid carrier protein [Acanthopleuribacter pedis]MBO1320879.1 sodium:alanine symporter family protein [Acanthopleuribacter pedis]